MSLPKPVLSSCVSETLVAAAVVSVLLVAALLLLVVAAVLAASGGGGGARASAGIWSNRSWRQSWAQRAPACSRRLRTVRQTA
jgi:hypothetical protein